MSNEYSSIVQDDLRDQQLLRRSYYIDTCDLAQTTCWSIPIVTKLT